MIDSSDFQLKQETKLISDTHWFHYKITRPASRRSDWPKYMFNQWQNTVGVEDEILHLGDVFFHSIDEYHAARLRELRGRKYMIVGNHDNKGIEWYKRNVDIDVVVEPYCGKRIRRAQYMFKEFGGLTYVFSHKPLTAEVCAGYRKAGYEIAPAMFDVNVHGHRHNKDPEQVNIQDGLGPVYVCVSVERIDYTPMPMYKIHELVKGVRNER